MATRPRFPGTTGPKIESGRRINECRGRADEHPAKRVLESGHLRIHHPGMVQPLRTSAPTENLAGLVERVTFHNDQNGFCVLRVKPAGSAT
jgi:hypothetical protein